MGTIEAPSLRAKRSNPEPQSKSGLLRRCAPRNDELKLAIAIALLSGGVCGNSAYACSLVNVAASTAEAVTVSGYYWIVSGLVGGIVILLEIYQRRSPSIILVATVALLIFHPRWTVAPGYGPDCTFQNVEASQFVLAGICLLLGYQVFRIVRSRKDVTPRCRPSSPQE
jgi:hypothetical protein